MKIIDKMKSVFLKNKVENDDEKFESETIIDEKDMYAYYLKNSKKYVLVKESKFPDWLSEQGIEWIEMNKEKFDYYREFQDFSVMFETIQELHEQEVLSNKTEEEYLKDYLEYGSKDYSKIIEKMKLFEIDKEQYEKLIEKIKDVIKTEIDSTLEKYTNKELETTRTYDEIMNSLIDEDKFEEKYPYIYDIEYEDKFYRCVDVAYIDRTGATGTHIQLDKIPNSKNSIFTYHKYIGGIYDGYISKMAIISGEERKTILNYWGFIEEQDKECEIKKIQAEQLPIGWIWEIFDDASGSLISPTGKSYFLFDWNTYEYQLTADSGYDYFGNRDDMGNELTFKDFMKYAENYANDKLVNLPENQRESRDEEDEEF